MSIQPDSKNDLISHDSMLLNEQIKGNVYCLKDVIVDKSGDITGNIHSKSCVVNGKVNGNILSVEYIEVTNTAIIEGNIKSGSIQIEAGSMINGFISIDKKIKLPSIITKIAKAISDRPDNKADLPEEEVYVTIKNNPVVVPEIKAEATEAKSEAPKIKTEVPEITTEVPEIPKTGKIITESPLKKENTDSSNDSWW